MPAPTIVTISSWTQKPAINASQPARMPTPAAAMSRVAVFDTSARSFRTRTISGFVTKKL
jgi:hypothetical protein